MMSRYKRPTGWRGESHRHYLAAKGISTKRYFRSKWKMFIAPEDATAFRRDVSSPEAEFDAQRGFRRTFQEGVDYDSERLYQLNRDLEEGEERNESRVGRIGVFSKEGSEIVEDYKENLPRNAREWWERYGKKEFEDDREWDDIPQQTKKVLYEQYESDFPPRFSDVDDEVRWQQGLDDL